MGASIRFELFGDLEALVAFYTDVLGFEFLRDERESGYVYLGRDSVRLGLLPASALGGADPRARSLRRPPHGVEIVLEVDDVGAEYERVTATGWPIEVPLVQRPWGLTDFRVLDPEGYYLRITS